jgi:hypothetical protein
VSIPGRDKDLYLLFYVLDRFEANPVCAGGTFPGSKADEAWR